MDLKDIGFYTLSDERVNRVVKARGRDVPYSRCEIIITDRCNFKCPYCRGVDCGTMDIYTIRETIDALGDIKAIRFSGGEPTMNLFLPDAVKYAKEKGVEHIAISTNGSKDTDYYLYLVDCGVNDFSISLDACCSSTGDMMAGNKKGAWNKVVKNIQKLSSVTYVTVGVVVTEDNLSEVNGIIEYAASLGVSDIRVIPSAQYNKFLTVLKSVNPILYENRPILKYRVTSAKENGHVRGLQSGDTHRCGLVMDDIAIKGDYHYPCIIYMREHGEPIGKISDGTDKIKEDRINWFLSHNTKRDNICCVNCLDVCIEYNNKFEEIDCATKL